MARRKWWKYKTPKVTWTQSLDGNTITVGSDTSLGNSSWVTLNSGTYDFTFTSPPTVTVAPVLNTRPPEPIFIGGNWTVNEEPLRGISADTMIIDEAV